MSSLDFVLQQALALSPDDRAYVMNALEQSLAAPQEGDTGSELLTELQRRSAAYRNGGTTARPAQDVLADLRERQARETAP
jgi:putative addiction module component (TIGR02574 family)